MAGADALNIASLVLAAPPILEPTFNCVKYIIDVSDNYKKAGQLHQESLLQLDTHLYQVQQFGRFLQENFKNLDDDTRSLCKRLVAVLEARLIDLVSVLCSITDPSGKIKKLEYIIKGRDAISRLCAQLELWEPAQSSPCEPGDVAHILQRADKMAKDSRVIAELFE
ncbi:hypothetical protein FDECE_13052 [Fusarium decemcellulare]|nr:hypothetical protein FDECE_13052 [Fusarium decemcellulare]